jgi:hypothetical protein
MRIRRVASLRSLLAQVRLQFQTLSGAEVAVNPADADFNPQGLNAVTVTLNSTGGQMTSMMATLATQSVAAPFGHPVRRLLAAIRRLQEAATGLETSIADVQAGRSGAAATDLARVGVSMHRANNALHSAQVLLAGICGSTC